MTEITKPNSIHFNMTIFVEYPLAIHIALQMYVCVFVWNLMFWTHFIFIDMKMRINIVDLIYSRELAEPLYYIQCNALISVYQKLYSLISVHSALWSTMTFTPPKKYRSVILIYESTPAWSFIMYHGWPTHVILIPSKIHHFQPFSSHLHLINECICMQFV